MNLSLRSGLVAIVFSKALGFVSTLLLANILGKEGYGEYGLIISTLSLFGILAQGSLGSVAANLITQKIKKSKHLASEGLGALFFTLFFSSSITAIVLYSISGYLADDLLGLPPLKTSLNIAALAILVLALQSVVEGLLLAFSAFRVRNIMGMVQSLMFLLCVVILAPRFSVVGAIFAFTLSNLASFFIAFFKLRSIMKATHLKVIKPKSMTPYKEIFGFTSPIILNSILILATNWFLPMELASEANGLSEVGIFTATTQIRVLILSTPFLLHSTFGPLMAGHFGGGNIKELELTYQKCYRLTIFSCVPLVAILIPFSSIIMQMFGKDFKVGSIAFGLSCLLGFVMAIANMLGVIIQSTGRVRFAIIPNLVYCGISITLSLVFIPNLGVVGVLVAMLIGQILQAWLLAKEGRMLQISTPNLMGAILSFLGLSILLWLSIYHNKYAYLLEFGLSIFIIIVAVSNLPINIIDNWIGFRSINKILDKFRFPD